MRHACKGLLLLTLLVPLLLMPTGLHSQDLIGAIRRGDTAAVQVLIEAGADVNAEDNYGQTALIVATALGHTDAVRALIEAGADVNARSKQGATALMVAQGAGQNEVVGILKKAGAKESTQASAHELWETYNNAGIEAYERGNYAEAEKQWLASLKEAETIGPEDPRLAFSLNNLANLYNDQGKYAEAEPLYQRALVIREKALGPGHSAVATSLENYADLLREMGRDDEAAEMETRAQAIRAKNAQ